MLTQTDTRELMNILIDAQRVTHSEIEKLRLMRLKSVLRTELRERAHYVRDMPAKQVKS